MSSRTAEVGSIASRSRSSAGNGAPRRRSVSSATRARLGDRPPAKPALDVVDRAPLEPGERRAEVAKEVASPALEPCEPEQTEQGAAERGLPEPSGLLDRERDSERDEDRLEHCAPAIDGVADDADPLGRRPAPEKLEHLGRDELGRASRSGALEEPDRTVERRRRRGRIREELPLEVGQRRREAAVDQLA